MAAHEWIEALPPELAGQQQLFRRLLAFCETEDKVRWLLIGCSVARGAADALSDLDLGMGVEGDDFDATVRLVRTAVDGIGELVESFEHRLADLHETHARIFAQYADRCQVDLVVFKASAAVASVPNFVVLYDPAGVLDAGRANPGDAGGASSSAVGASTPRPASGTTPPSAATPDKIREWAFQSWCALANLGKYLRRGSAWEAFDQLHGARAELWKLWAAALRVPDPQYGLTSILDFAPERLPHGPVATVSDLDPESLLKAGKALARQLTDVALHLSAEQRAALPDAMGRYVSKDLQALRLRP